MAGPQKIVCIASFPPPLAGQSIAAQILCDALRRDYAQCFELLNLDLSEAVGGESGCRRLHKMLKIALKLGFYCITHEDLGVYLQLGHGKASVVRDSVFLAIAQVMGKKCVGHVHGSGYRLALESLPAVLQKPARFFASRCAAAVVLSSSLRPMFEGILPAERIFEVPNGVESYIEEAARGFAREYEQNHRKVHVLYLSNLLQAKGFGVLLEAARQCARENAGLHFDFVGPKVEGQGPDIEEFIARHNLDNVTWHGSLEGEAKCRVYESADIFCLPSRYEGQPLCILEAMHFALPVVCSPVGAIPDIFAGNDGVHFLPPDDAGLWARTLNALGKDSTRRAAMGQSNRVRAGAHYTAQRHAALMAALFERSFGLNAMGERTAE